MIPEIRITCDGRETFINSVTVEQYKKYVNLMRKNGSEKISDAMFFNKRILQEIFGNEVSLETLEKMDAVEFMTASKGIHFIMQDIIPEKFAILGDGEQVEKEESGFDEYDIENGYEDEQQETDMWKVCGENIDRITKIAIRLLKNSYNQCMKSDIVELLEYLKFELDTIDEK